MKVIPRVILLLASVTLSSFALTVQVSRVLDGKGGVIQNVRLTVEGTKIVSVEPGRTGPADYNLHDVTLMPGWIDTHDHIVWHFNKEDRADTTRRNLRRNSPSMQPEMPMSP